MHLFRTDFLVCSPVGFLAVAAAIPPLTAALAGRSQRGVIWPSIRVAGGFFGLLLALPARDRHLWSLHAPGWTLLPAAFPCFLNRISHIFVDCCLSLGHHLRPHALGVYRWPALVSSGMYGCPLCVTEATPASLSFDVFCFIAYFAWLPAHYGSLVCPEYFRFRYATVSRRLPHALAYLLRSVVCLSCQSANTGILVPFLGSPRILNARLWALGLNLANALAVQGEVFLLPLIGLGLVVFPERTAHSIGCTGMAADAGCDDGRFSFRRRAWRLLPFRCGPADGLVGTGTAGPGTPDRVGPAETRPGKQPRPAAFSGWRWSAWRFC